MQTNRKTLMPLAVLFIVLNAFFISGNNLLNKWGMDQNVLIIGNLIFNDHNIVLLFNCQQGIKK
jgi:hypothetical protein